ncbi:CocE/NonD family hydrolase [Lentzea alba]|uniref:CocE/NonD family hydrolase n=1 Tax=Lentzea alba TaxID=2714351 RepID=UPI0039BEE3ED
MSVASAVLGRVWGLPPRRNRVRVDRAIEVTMRDGVRLLADHFVPVTAERAPTILVRCPYGRSAPYTLLQARFYAERGYHVLFQSCRGTFGSGGVFTPGVDETRDAQDTVAWLRDQDWFDGRLAVLGGSYLGFTGWALAADPPPELTAMVVMIGVHDLGAAMYRQGPLELYNGRSWADLIAGQESTGPLRGLVRAMRAERRLADEMTRLPLSGTGVPWYDDWARRPDLTDPYWERFRVTEALRRSTVPTLLIGGWHDFFLNQTIEQYEALRARDVDVAMTVGPWTHLNVDNRISLTEGISWFDAHTARRAPARRGTPVRVFVGGAGWQNHRSWPPPDTRSATWYLHSGQRLAEQPSTQDSSGTAFRYDPRDPTPSVGGRVMALSGGAKDNRKLEARPDVLVFTSEPLTTPVEVHGSPVVELHVTSDNANADLFARLCDVSPAGRSTNVTDQIVRCDGREAVRITLDPTAHRFEAGHRVRLQVSGGAFPRFARNLGTGDDPGTGTTVRAAARTVHHDAGRPSHLSLPVRG